jgi:hypothetical protein
VPDHAARRTAFPDLSPTASPTRRSRWPNCRASVRQGSRHGAGRASSRPIDIVIGTHKLLSKDIQFKNLGLTIIDEEHRFGVRQKERMKELRAEVDVLTLTATPIPAHAGDVAGRHPRFLGDRHRAAEAPVDQDLRATVLRRPDPRSLPARTEARRPDLLPAQRGGHHPHHVRATGQTAAGSAHRDRPRPDAGTRTGTRDARLHPPALQPAAVHHHHRNRHRRAHRQHHHHEPRRQVRPGATAPVARPRRPFAPPGLRLPADAAQRSEA